MLYNFKIKIFIWSILTLLITVGYGQPPGDGTPIADTPKDLDLDYVPLLPKCVNASINVTYNNGNINTHANVLDLNCPGNTNIIIDASFDWTQYCLSTFCDFYFELYICGVNVRTINIDQKQTQLNLLLNGGGFIFDRLIEEYDMKSRDCEIELRLMRKCGLITVVSATYKAPLQIINSSNIATSYYYVDNLVGNFHEKPSRVLSGIKACCCNGYNQSDCNDNAVIVKFEEISEFYSQVQSQNTTTHSLVFSAALSGEVSTPKGQFLNGKGAMSGGYNYNMSWQTSNTSGFKGTVKVTAQGNWPLRPYPGTCVSATYYTLWEKWERQKWEADCQNGDSKVATINSWNQPEILNGNIVLYYDSQVQVSECGNGNRRSVDTRLKIFATYNRSNCTGNLTMGLVDSDLDQQTTQVWWTNENGEIFKSLNLNNVPYGKYTIHMEDDCCNYFTETRILCPNMVESQWYKKGEQFCKDFSCDGGCTFNQCVTPDRIEDIFDKNQKKCIKEYYYNNQLLGTTSVDATFETNYNSTSKQCIRVYNCSGNPGGGETISEAAQFGFWTYNSFNNLCERSVICFNEPMPPTLLDTEKPEIVYQNNSSLCVAKCDNFPSSSFFPINPGFWQWNSSQGCTKQVTCVAADGPFTVNGTASYNNWAYNSNSNLCTSNVSCDNTNVFGAVNSVFPQSVGLWSYNTASPLNQQCRREIYCSGNLVIEYAAPTFNTWTCVCLVGTATGYNTYCGTQQVDYVPCPPYNACFDDGGDLENRTTSHFPISFYPNPTSNHIIFEGLTENESYNVQIFNQVGSLILNQKLNGNQCDVSELPSGVHFVRLSQYGIDVFTSKFIKL